MHLRPWLQLPNSIKSAHSRVLEKSGCCPDLKIRGDLTFNSEPEWGCLFSPKTHTKKTHPIFKMFFQNENEVTSSFANAPSHEQIGISLPGCRLPWQRICTNEFAYGAAILRTDSWKHFCNIWGFSADFQLGAYMFALVISKVEII